MITRQEIRRLMIFCPPRHGKSSLATIHYPAYRLECDPSCRIVIACYNQTLAEKFSRRIRGIVRQRGIVPLDPERSAVDDWLTQAGGGVRAVGIGGGVTGHGFDLLIIDDPVKSREEANSDAYRGRCWDWYTDDIYTRQEPGAAIVLIQTRWHQDDLAGRILASEQAPDWTVVSLPAEAEANDPLGRPLGAALCPERYDLPALHDLAATLQGSYWALFQQRPQPEGGLLFRALPTDAYLDAAPATARRVRRWDVASSTGKGDFTVGLLLAALPNNTYVIEDVVRGQWATDERDRVMRQTAEADRARGVVRHIVPQDPGSAGLDMARAFTRLLAGFTVSTERETGDKVTRADPLASQWNAGNVRLLRAAWNAALLSEFASFPSGRHDDIVDAASGAFAALAAPREMAWA